MKYILTILLALLLPLQTASAKSLIDIQQVVSPKHKITAWLVSDTTNPVLSMDFSFIGAGTKHDPETKQGLIRLLSNTLDEGAGDLNSQAFQKTLNDNSIALSFSADRDNFSGSLKTLSRTQDKAFNLLQLSLTQPRFDQQPLTRMIEANKSRIKSSLHKPDWLAARISNDIIFAGHPYAKNSGGTLSSLSSISPEDLRSHFDTALALDNLKIAVSGNITAKELAPLLDDVFGNMQKENALPAIEDIQLQNSGQTFLYKQGIPQTIINIYQNGIDVLSPDYQHAQIMNFILGSSGFGSRLMQTIREEKGLTYGIYSSLSAYKHTNSLSVSSSTKNESAQELLNLVTAEFNKLKNGDISETELTSAKTYLIGQLPLSLTSTDNISSLLLSLQAKGLPANYLDQREAIITGATIEDIQNIAAKLLAPESLTTILVGSPALDIPANIIETLPNVE